MICHLEGLPALGAAVLAHLLVHDPLVGDQIDNLLVAEVALVPDPLVDVADVLGLEVLVGEGGGAVLVVAGQSFSLVCFQSYY